MSRVRFCQRIDFVRKMSFLMRLALAKRKIKHLPMPSLRIVSLLITPQHQYFQPEISPSALDESSKDRKLKENGIRRLHVRKKRAVGILVVDPSPKSPS